MNNPDMHNADERELWAWGQAERLLHAMAQTRPTSGHRELVTAWLIDAVQRGLKAAQPEPKPYAMTPALKAALRRNMGLLPSTSTPTAQESA